MASAAASGRKPAPAMLYLSSERTSAARNAREAAMTARSALNTLDVRAGMLARARRLRERPARQTLLCLALVGLLGLADLSQTGSAAAMDRQLERLRAEQQTLLRQDQEARAHLAQAESPATIAREAAALGLAPAPFGAIPVLVLPTPAAGGTP